MIRAKRFPDEKETETRERTSHGTRLERRAATQLVDVGIRDARRPRWPTGQDSCLIDIDISINTDTKTNTNTNTRCSNLRNARIEARAPGRPRSTASWLLSRGKGVAILFRPACLPKKFLELPRQ